MSTAFLCSVVQYSGVSGNIAFESCIFISLHSWWLSPDFSWILKWINKMIQTRHILPALSGLVFILLLTACATSQPAPDPLPSWASRVSKQRIIDFVAKVTDSNSKTFVPIELQTY